MFDFFLSNLSPLDLLFLSYCYSLHVKYLKRYGESGQPCLVPDFRGIAVSFSSFNLMLAVDLCIPFIIFRYVLFIPDLNKTFIMKGCWILSNTFS